MTLESPRRLERKDFDTLYETDFPVVARFVSRYGGRMEDARDIFQDAVVIYYEKCRDDGFHIASTRTAYLLGIAKHLWIRKFNATKRVVPLEAWEETIAIPDDLYTHAIPEKILAWLERAGLKCMELLVAFYYDRLSIDMIRKRFGYGSDRSATVQKFKCLEKVRNEVKRRSLNYEDFTE